MTDVIGGIGLERDGRRFQFGFRRLGADDDAVTAGFTDGLDHQPLQIGECVSQSFWFTADMRFDVGQDGFLVEIIFDDTRHVGIDGLVVGDAGADGVGQRNGAAAHGAQQSRHT